jgi:hypothetical protein
MPDANHGVAAKELLMKTKSTLAFALIATALAAPAPAQQGGKIEEAIISSEPGGARPSAR